MRPVSRGEAPVGESGRPVVFQDYKDALDPLRKRIGEYCSYCERRVTNQPAVEHIQPKSNHRDLETSWENFLLSCAICNSVKGDKPVALERFLWPHRDNTFRAFDYTEGGVLDVARRLRGPLRRQAQALLELVGLDRHPGAGPDQMPSSRDQRWRERREIWEKAMLALDRLRMRPDAMMRQQILETARGFGFWSVWMTIFEREPEMRQMFIEGFRGTCRECFDGNGAPLRRPGGRL